MSRQIIGQQFFETEYFPFKKTGPGQIQTEDLHHPRHIRFLQAKLDRNAWKLELIMNHDTSDCVKQDVIPKNSLF